MNCGIDFASTNRECVRFSASIHMPQEVDQLGIDLRREFLLSPVPAAGKEHGLPQIRQRGLHRLDVPKYEERSSLVSPYSWARRNWTRLPSVMSDAERSLPLSKSVGWPHQRVSAVRNAASRLAGEVSSVAQATYPSGRTSTIGMVASTRPAHLCLMAAPAGARSTNLPPRKISYSRVSLAFPDANRTSGARRPASRCSPRGAAYAMPDTARLTKAGGETNRPTTLASSQRAARVACDWARVSLGSVSLPAQYGARRDIARS